MADATPEGAPEPVDSTELEAQALVADVPALIERSALIRPAAHADELLGAFRSFEDLKSKLLIAADYQSIQGKQFPKKSAMRKLGTAFAVSTDLERCDIEREGRLITWVMCMVKATAPNGRHEDGLGAADLYERCCERDCRKGGQHRHCPAAKGEECSGTQHWSNSQHDLVATAHTRAKNRAVGDLVAFGAVSADEMNQRDGEHDTTGSAETGPWQEMGYPTLREMQDHHALYQQWGLAMGDEARDEIKLYRTKIGADDWPIRKSKLTAILAEMAKRLGFDVNEHLEKLRTEARTDRGPEEGPAAPADTAASAPTGDGGEAPAEAEIVGEHPQTEAAADADPSIDDAEVVSEAQQSGPPPAQAARPDAERAPVVSDTEEPVDPVAPAAAAPAGSEPDAGSGAGADAPSAPSPEPARAPTAPSVPNPAPGADGPGAEERPSEKGQRTRFAMLCQEESVGLTPDERHQVISVLTQARTASSTETTYDEMELAIKAGKLMRDGWLTLGILDGDMALTEYKAEQLPHTTLIAIAPDEFDGDPTTSPGMKFLHELQSREKAAANA